jgi:hypothetical protein
MQIHPRPDTVLTQPLPTRRSETVQILRPDQGAPAGIPTIGSRHTTEISGVEQPLPIQMTRQIRTAPGAVITYRSTDGHQSWLKSGPPSFLN